MLVFFQNQSRGWTAIRHQGRGSARCHGSRGIAAPSCCRRVDCFCDYCLCGELSTHAGFCRKNHGHIFRRPMEKFLALDFGSPYYSFSSFSLQADHGNLLKAVSNAVY